MGNTTSIMKLVLVNGNLIPMDEVANWDFK